MLTTWKVMKSIFTVLFVVISLFLQVPVNASPQCRAIFQNKIILIVSQYCSQCKKALPMIENIVAEQKLEKIFQLLNVNNKVDRKFIKENKFSVKYVPTLIVNCHYTVGAKSEKEYRHIILNQHGQ